jgi:hypothetical protein
VPQCTLRALIGLCLCTKRPGPNIGQSCFCGADDALIVKSDCPIQIPKICIRCTSKVHDLHIKFIIIIIIIIIVNWSCNNPVTEWRGKGVDEQGILERFFVVRIGFGYHPATYPKPTGSSGWAVELITHPEPRLRINGSINLPPLRYVGLACLIKQR